MGSGRARRQSTLSDRSHARVQWAGLLERPSLGAEKLFVSAQALHRRLAIGHGLDQNHQIIDLGGVVRPAADAGNFGWRGDGRCHGDHFGGLRCCLGLGVGNFGGNGLLAGQRLGSGSGLAVTTRVSGFSLALGSGSGFLRHARQPFLLTLLGGQDFAFFARFFFGM
jgi:hypothetical protein